MPPQTVALPQIGVVGPGTVLAGKYRVEGILGQGGMGVVVAATHVGLEQKVAIKLIVNGGAASREAVARFEREARAAVRLKSEHVVHVSDVGQLPDGSPYMVMEYLAGQDLARVVQRRGPLPIADAVEYVLQACEALAEAHRIGIVHRDLKPANLFLTERPDGSPLVKVLDFGISKAALEAGTPEAPKLTQTHAVIGSPAYMSPEQLKSAHDVDARTDVWSLGLSLYELLAGQTAFVATTLAELHVAILAEPPKPLRQRRPDVPYALEAVILRCLEKNAAARFADVGELARALAEFGPPRSTVHVERASRIVGASGGAPSAPSPPVYAQGAAPSYATSQAPWAQPPPYGPDPRMLPTVMNTYPQGGYPTLPSSQPMVPARSGAASPAWAFAGVIVLFMLLAMGFGGCALCVAISR